MNLTIFDSSCKTHTKEGLCSMRLNKTVISLSKAFCKLADIKENDKVAIGYETISKKDGSADKEWYIWKSENGFTVRGVTGTFIFNSAVSANELYSDLKYLTESKESIFMLISKQPIIENGVTYYCILLSSAKRTIRNRR